MADQTTTPKTRTVTLTGRRPVQIREDEWPVIARGKGDSYTGSDYGRYQQALSQGECDEYSLIVRQHADGRAIVYGVLSAAISGESHRGGVLLPAGADLAEAIRAVGDECGLPGGIIRACLADLPAEIL